MSEQGKEREWRATTGSAHPGGCQCGDRECERANAAAAVKGAALLSSDVLGMLRRFAAERGTDIRMVLDPASGRFLLREVVRKAASDAGVVEVHVGPSLPGPFPQHGVAEQMPATTAPMLLGSSYTKCECGCVIWLSKAPETPSAMLEVALKHLRDADRLSHEAGWPLGLSRAIGDAKEALRVLKREAEAREGQQTRACEGMPQNVGNPCWQCEAPLGTTGDFMTCEAKRREAKP